MKLELSEAEVEYPMIPAQAKLRFYVWDDDTCTLVEADQLSAACEVPDDC